MVATIGLTGCAQPWEPLVDEVESLTGQEVVDCGGPTYRDPEGQADTACIDGAAEAREPHQYWVTPQRTVEGDPLFQGVLRFWLDDEEHAWGIYDTRADSFGPGTVTVVRCVGEVCEPPECVRGC